MKIKVIDTIALATLGGFILYFIYDAVFNGYTITFNNLMAIFLWLFIIVYKVIYPVKSKYFVFCLLILAVFDIACITNYRIFIGIHTANDIYQIPFSFISFLLLVIYSAVNFGALIDLYRIIFYGSAEEQLDKQDKLTQFYYKKFKDCEDEEFSKIFNSINDYPEAAKLALYKLKEEKN